MAVVSTYRSAYCRAVCRAADLLTVQPITGITSSHLSVPICACARGHFRAISTTTSTSESFTFSNQRRLHLQQQILNSVYSLSTSAQYNTIDDSSSFQITRDKYGRHRRLTPDIVSNHNPDAASKALLAAYRIESNLTMTKIEQKLVDTFRIDRSVLVREIEEAASLQPKGRETAEFGSLGLYKYYAVDDRAGIRTFKRVPCREDLNKTRDMQQEVLKINYHAELPGPMCLSVDEEYVARISIPSSTFGGNATSTLIVRHIESGNEYTICPSFGLHGVVFGLGYRTNDSERIYDMYFTTTNALGRPDSVYRVAFSDRDGFDATMDPELLLHDNDEANHVDIKRSKGKQWMIMQSTSKNSNEVHLLGPPDNEGASSSPVLVRRREEGVIYYVECGDSDDDMFILAHCMADGSNLGHASSLGEEMSLFQARIQDVPLVGFSGNSRALNFHDGSHFIEEMDIFETHVALYERSFDDGTQRIRVVDRTGLSELESASSFVPLPIVSNGCLTITPGGNLWYESTNLHFNIETPVKPPTTCTYDMKEGTIALSEGIGPGSNVMHARVFARSLDGTNVPMSLIGKRGDNEVEDIEEEVIFGQKRPTILVAYGSCGEMNSMVYDPTVAPLIHRGFVLAYAHTRGGGELGRSWYRKGRGYDKERAIEDYLACAESLVGDLSVAGKGQLAAKGFSAGGILAAAAVNESPHLFSALSLINPFLDVSGSMVDPTLPLTEHELDEWGDPLNDKMAETVIDRYCPFANLRPQLYPPTFLVGTVDDFNVPYWHASTYALKQREIMMQMREDSVDDQLGSIGGNNDDVLLQIEEHGGHNLHSRRLDVASLECAFLLGELSSSGATAVDAKWKDNDKSSLLGALWKSMMYK